jgi:hypothetical protein
MSFLFGAPQDAGSPPNHTPAHAASATPVPPPVKPKGRAPPNDANPEPKNLMRRFNRASGEPQTP